MRIVDTSRKVSSQKKRPKLKSKVLLLGIVVLACGATAAYLTNRSQETVERVTPITIENTQEQSPPTMIVKDFTPSEFKSLYGGFAYPFTVQIEAPPVITTDPVADKRIQDLAIARGYELRSVPMANQLVEVSPGFFAQKLTAESFQNLINLMNNNNLPLQVTSVYRSVSDQLELFIERLAEKGVDINDTDSIASGDYDEAISLLLETVAPPGYSRHHTGYTVDFQCGWAGLREFESSPCFEYMSADNYKVMKELGFIPSYPKGAELQGPEPESWEYIWVGKEALY